MKTNLIRTLLLIAEQEPSFRDRIREMIMEAMTPSEELTQHEIEIGRKEGKLACIREHKLRTGLSLVESKNRAEDEFKRLGLKFLGEE